MHGDVSAIKRDVAHQGRAIDQLRQGVEKKTGETAANIQRLDDHLRQLERRQITVEGEITNLHRLISRIERFLALFDSGDVPHLRLPKIPPGGE
jgi:DNA repair exonuclease SbcCD ATPase subunit